MKGRGMSHWNIGLSWLLLASDGTSGTMNWNAILNSLIFGVIGIVLAVLGFKVFDWITPKINVQHELAEKHNVAVAIVCAAVILGICAIVAVAVH
jgi:putative membrane protein